MCLLNYSPYLTFWSSLKEAFVASILTKNVTLGAYINWASTLNCNKTPNMLVGMFLPFVFVFIISPENRMGFHSQHTLAWLLFGAFIQSFFDTLSLGGSMFIVPRTSNGPCMPSRASWAMPQCAEEKLSKCQISTPHFIYQSMELWKNLSAHDSNCNS